MSSKKPRRIGRWTIVRRVVQVVALVAFAPPLLAAGWGLFGGVPTYEDAAHTPAELPFFGSLSSGMVGPVATLDPFAVLQVVFAGKTFDVSWLLYALPVLLVYGLVRGRAFCGWACPVNMLLEAVDWLRGKLGLQVRETALPRHTKVWVAVGVLVVSALVSVPVFEVVSPIGAVAKGLLFGSTLGLVTLVAIVVLELFFGHRVWCRSLCPLGGFYEVLGKVGQVNVAIDAKKCIHCGKCQHVCLADPVILEPALQGRDSIVRAGDCMACGACIDACPTDALGFKLGRWGLRAEDVAGGEPAACGEKGAE